MRDRQIDFLVLRNYEGLPDVLGNDLDLLVQAQDRSRAERAIVSAVHPLGYRLHNRAEFGCTSLFLWHKDSGAQLHVDLFAQLEWRGFKILSTQAVLEDRITGELFDIPSPIHEGVVKLLTRLLYSGIVENRYRSAITSSFSKNPEAALAALSNGFGVAVSESIVGNVLEADWSAIESRVSSLRAGLVARNVLRAPLETIGSLLRDGLRLTCRALQPPGLCVVFLGVSDEDEETLLDTVGRELEPSFHSLKRQPFRPTGQSTQSPRGVLTSVGWLGLSAGRHTAQYVTSVMPLLSRLTLVLSEGHPLDVFVDPERHGYSGPAWLAKLIGRVTPQPDLFVMLDRSAVACGNRHDSAAAEVAPRKRTTYRELANSIPSSYVVDNSWPPDAVVRDIVCIILEFMVQRTAQRRRSTNHDRTTSDTSRPSTSTS